MSKEETIKLVLRLPPKLHKRCQALADERGMSLNTYIIHILEQFGDALPEDTEERILERIKRLEKAVFGDKK